MLPRSPPCAFVTGATGFIGRHLIRRCNASGIKVVPVVRSIETSQRLGMKTSVRFDTLDTLPVEPNCTPYMVHLAGASRETKDNSLHDASISTTKKAVSFAERVGVCRNIYVSGFGVHDNSADTFIHVKAQAESLISNSYVPHTILRCSYVLGNGDELTPRIIEQTLKGEIDIPGTGEYRLQPIYVEDLVEVILNAMLEEGSDSLTQNVLGEPISFKSFVELVTSHLGLHPKLKHMGLDELLRRGISETDPPFSPSELAILVLDAVGEPTRSCFGVRIQPLQEIMDRLIETNLHSS